MKQAAGLTGAFLFSLLLGGSAPAASPPAGHDEALEAVAWKADFESGSVGAWSSYPPAQDTAYDPTIWVKKVEGNPGLCLVREITPYTEDAYIFGVRKKTRLELDASSRISFRYYVKSYAGAKEIIVKLGFAGGTALDIAVPVWSVQKWTEASVSLAEFIGGGAARPLEAVAILANCPHAVPETKLRLAVDDLTITGFRVKKVAIQTPATHELEELGVSVARDHFDKGRDVLFSGSFPVPVKRAVITLNRTWNRQNPPVKKTLRLRAAGWETAVSGKDLAAGLWEAVIAGKTNSGRSLETRVFFLVQDAKNAPGHPYLLATASDLVRIREASKSGHTRDVWAKVREGAAEFRDRYDPAVFNYNLDAYDEIFWLPTYEGYVRALQTPSQFIRENSIVYAVSGDKAAGQAARKALLRIAAWPSFVHPHILNQGQFTYWPAGLALIDFAVGYDFVYDLLSPEERRTIADALYNKGVTEVFKEYVRDNRVSSNTSNWISHVAGGGILCALAIGCEYPAAQIEPYLTGMMVKLKEFIAASFDPDGYYGEGYYYHNFAMQSLSHTLPALERSFAMAPPADVMNSFQYLPYQQDNETGRIYEFGDAHDDLIPSSMSNFAYVLARDGAPRLRWLYEQRPGNSYLDLLFPATAGASEPPQSLPLSKRLRGVGSTILRSGFEHDDFALVFKCGPFFNHQHFDQGSFFLADRGELFIEECGNSNYYEDPWYPRLYIQAGGHDCLLTDGKVESQRSGDFRHDVSGWQDYARTTDFLEFAGGAFLSTDLAPVYKGKWRSLSRSLLYIRPRTLLIIDRGEGADGVDRLTARFHAPRKEDIVLDEGAAAIVRGGKQLWLKTLFPEAVERRAAKRPMSLNEFKAENPITMKARGFLELEVPVENGVAGLVNVLSTDGEIISSLSAADWSTHQEITVGGSRYFLGASGGKSYEADGILTDALVFHKGADGFLAARATRVEEGGRALLKSDRRGSFVVTDEGQMTKIAYSAPEGTRLEVSLSRKPRCVVIDGRAAAKWEYRNGRVGLDLPAGEGTVAIAL
jgi:Heparinase II/III-like protein